MSLDLDDEEDAPEPEWMQIVTETPKVQEEAIPGEDGSGGALAEETPAAEKPLVDEAALKEFAAEEMLLEESAASTLDETAVGEAAPDQAGGEEAIMEDSLDGAGLKEDAGDGLAVAPDVSKVALAATVEDAMEDTKEEAVAKEAAVGEAVLMDDKTAEEEELVKHALSLAEPPAVEDLVMGETAADDAAADDEAWEETAEPVDAAMSLSKSDAPAAGIKRSAPAATRQAAGPPVKRAREAPVKAAPALPPLEELLEQLPTAVRAKFDLLSKRLVLKAEAAQALLQADAKDALVILQALGSREKVADPTRFVVGSLRKRAEMKAAAGASEKPTKDRPPVEATGPKPPKAIVRSKSGSVAGPPPSAPASVGVAKAKVAKTPKASSQAAPAQGADDDTPRPPAVAPSRPPPRRAAAGGPVGEAAALTKKGEASASVMEDLVKYSPSAASRPAAVQKKKEPPKTPTMPSWDAADADAEGQDASKSPEKTSADSWKKPTGASFQKQDSDSWERPWGKQVPEETPWGKQAGTSWDNQTDNSWERWNKESNASWGQSEPPRIRSATGAALSAAAPPKAPEGPPKKKWSMSSSVVAGRPGAAPTKRDGLEFEQEAVQEKLMALNDSKVWKAKVPLDDAALSALLKIDAGSALDILADVEGQGAKCRLPSLFVQQAALKVRMASKG